MLVLPYIRLLRGRWVAGRGARSKPLGNRSEKGTNPGPQLQARPSSDRGDPARSRSSPGQEPPRSNLHRWRGGARRRAGCAWPQPPGQGNSPNGAAPDCLFANMHSPPATAPQSGERRARRRPASGQGPDLAQLQHLPLLLSERGRGTRWTAGYRIIQTNNGQKWVETTYLEAENIKKRWQEYTEELSKKDLHDQDNHDGVIHT